MKLIMELSSEPILQRIAEKVIDMEVDINEVVQTTALKVLSDIKTIICDESMNEFDKIEGIVSVFEKYNIDTQTDVVIIDN